MAFIPVPNTARVEMIYSIFQQTTENVLHVRNAVPFTDVTLLQLATAMGAWWGGEMPALISDSLTLTTIRCTDLDVEESYQVEFNPFEDNLGTRVSPALPLNVTCAIKFGTGLTGRSNRGRAYVVGLCEDQVTGNELITARATELVAAFQEINTYLTAVSAFWSHVIVSYVTGGVPREEGLATDVVAYSTDAFVDSQRRRLTGRGQ